MILLSQSEAPNWRYTDILDDILPGNKALVYRLDLFRRGSRLEIGGPHDAHQNVDLLLCGFLLEFFFYIGVRLRVLLDLGGQSRVLDLLRNQNVDRLLDAHDSVGNGHAKYPLEQ